MRIKGFCLFYIIILFYQFGSRSGIIAQYLHRRYIKTLYKDKAAA